MEKKQLGVQELIQDYKRSIKEDDNDFDKKISENYSTAIIDPKEELKPPQTAFVQIINDFEERIFGTLGNFSLISGKAKAKKSFLVQMIVAALMTNKEINGIKGCLPKNKRKGILFDTEQGKYHVQLAQNRIYRIAGVKEGDLDVVMLRKYKPSERLKLIEYGINKNKDNLGYVVIDGIRDLVNSINDEESATMLTSMLLKWTEELNIHIIVVLHQNKSNEFARGHIGTEAVNKAETHLSAAVNPITKSITEVVPLEVRNEAPEPFAFEIFDGIPTLIDNYEIRTAKKNSEIDVTEIKEETLNSMFKEIFEKNSKIGYGELFVLVKLKFKEFFGRKIGDNKIKELIKYSRIKKLIIQEGRGKPYMLGSL